MSSGFYVVDESAADYPHESASPVSFDTALSQAQSLASRGHDVRVLYSEEATQAELKAFTDHGILAERASTA